MHENVQDKNTQMFRWLFPRTLPTKRGVLDLCHFAIFLRL